MPMEITRVDLSGGAVHRTPLIKAEQSEQWMALWDDDGLASPRRGEAKRIGELCLNNIFLLPFYPPPL